MLPPRPPAALGASIVEAAHGAEDPAAFQRATLAILAPVGFDVAFFEIKQRPAPVATGFDAGLLEAASGRWPLYARELLPVGRALAAHGVVIDAEVLGASWERLAYFQEVVRPQQGTSSLFARLSLGGEEIGRLVLGRCGSRFDAGDAAALRALLAPLSVGLGAVLQAERSRAARAPLLAATLTPREQEVLRLVHLGYTNPEIARALGTSPNTVRNQVSALLGKVGATTRAELVALTVRA